MSRGVEGPSSICGMTQDDCHQGVTAPGHLGEGHGHYSRIENLSEERADTPIAPFLLACYAILW